MCMSGVSVCVYAGGEREKLDDARTGDNDNDDNERVTARAPDHRRRTRQRTPFVVVAATIARHESVIERMERTSRCAFILARQRFA